MFYITIISQIKLILQINEQKKKRVEAVAMRIKELLETKNISLELLETKSNISRFEMNSILNGNNINIDLETLRKITKGLEIEMCDFLDSELFNYKNLEINGQINHSLK